MEQKNVKKTMAPYSVVTLVLGICAIIFNFVFIGIACGIVGLIFANKGLAQYKRIPENYTGKDMLIAGKITAIVGIILGMISIINGIISIMMTAFVLSQYDSIIDSIFNNVFSLIEHIELLIERHK